MPVANGAGFDHRRDLGQWLPADADRCTSEFLAPAIGEAMRLVGGQLIPQVGDLGAQAGDLGAQVGHLGDVGLILSALDGGGAQMNGESNIFLRGGRLLTRV